MFGGEGKFSIAILGHGDIPAQPTAVSGGGSVGGSGGEGTRDKMMLECVCVLGVHGVVFQSPLTVSPHVKL